jgi:hypothetical protein
MFEKEIILEEQLATLSLFQCRPGEKIAGQHKPKRGQTFNRKIRVCQPGLADQQAREVVGTA